MMVASPSLSLDEGFWVRATIVPASGVDGL
jgi:hypothetical protein